MSTQNKTPSALDLEAYWMPFSANRRFKQSPKMMQSASGMIYKTADGQEILDGTAGLWCVNAGHNQPHIKQAIKTQLDELDFCHNFNMGHPKPFEFATKLMAAFPKEFNHVFFTNSGSEAVDTALKIALAYHFCRDDGRRTRFIGREKAYHGVNFGGTSVGGLPYVRKVFGPLLPGVDHLPHTLDIKRNAFSRGLPTHGCELADELEKIVALHESCNIAAVIVEPVSGAGGVLPPPIGYLKKLREICDTHGILLIFDEVITGFGRLGKICAAERFDVIPDIITSAKGLTNGTVPMGATIVSDKVYDAFMQGPEEVVELFHGYTYSGHPLASAAGLATLETYQNDNLFDGVLQKEKHWENAAHQLKNSPHVIDVRNIGLLAAIELEPLAAAPAARAAEVYEKCFAKGVLVRPIGSTIALSPPLIIDETQIDTLFQTINEVLQSVA